GDAVAIFCTDAFLQQVPGDRSINSTGIDVDKAEPAGKLSRDTAFPRSSRTVNGNLPMEISLERAHRVEGLTVVVHRTATQRALLVVSGAAPHSAASLPFQLSSGALGLREPITGVLICIRFGLVNSSSTVSNPGYDSRIHSASWMTVSPSAKRPAMAKAIAMR